MRCTVTQLIPDQLIEWTVRAVGKPPIGHVNGWQIELLTDGECLVSRYCDWTNISDELRVRVPLACRACRPVAALGREPRSPRHAARAVVRRASDRPRQHQRHKLCLLVMIGVRADGRKELIALADGYRESAEWRADLRDIARRGMRARARGRRRRAPTARNSPSPRRSPHVGNLRPPEDR